MSILILVGADLSTKKKVVYKVQFDLLVLVLSKLILHY